ncbi:MAG: cation:proton antiporter [Phycisphaerales bacterium]|jgi:CPA2 family monovalent cation:H+ antiporter-2
MLATLANAAQAPLAVQLLVMLATAALVATLFRRLKLELIPGYLMAGVLVGPHAIGVVHDPAAVDSISQLAIILLMFAIGLHLDVSSIRRGLAPILVVGAASTILVTLVSWMTMVLGGATAPRGLVMAMALSMSSTAVAVRVLMSRREGRTPHGRVTLGVAIVQDLLSVVVMALLPPLAKWAGVENAMVVSSSRLPAWAEFVSAAGISLGGITVMIFGGRYLLPRLLGFVAKVGSSELVLVVSAAVALGAAIGTSAIGFSSEMGAFLAGFLLAGTPFRYQLSGQLAPMRDLLMAVFFTAVGMNVSPVMVGSHLGVVIFGALGLVVVKALCIGGTSWAAGLAGRSSLLTGVYLASAGEFSLVVLAAAASAGILTGEQVGTCIAVVIVSLVLAPMLVGPANAWAIRLVGLKPPPWARGSALNGAAAEEDAHATAGRHVIIAGFGPVGRTLADRFAVLGIPFTVIELNPRTVQRQATLGRPIVYGDVTNPDVLESAGIEHADAVLLTIPDDEATLRACQAIRAAAPDVFIAARTNFLSGKFLAHQLGADLVTVEEIATAQAMERDVLEQLTKFRKEPGGAYPSPAVYGEVEPGGARA